MLAVVALAGASWRYSDEITRPKPHRPLESGLTVAALDESTITLAGTRVARDGRAWFVEWPGGYGMAGDLVAADSTRVTRRFRVLAGRLVAGAAVDLGSYLYSGDPQQALGMPFEEVEVPAPLSDCPAWLVPGPRRIWVVLVHGMAAGRGEALRPLPTVAGLGFPSLAITYRNGPGAARSADGLYHLGASEWEDVEAGVRYALRHGAQNVILFGYSMGGAVVANFLHRSALAGSVVGVILDAPVLDWDATVRLAARRRRVPSFLTTLAEGVVSLRTGFRWSGSEGKVRPQQFRMPVLLYHGSADGTVPIAPSESLAAALGEQVTFVRTEGAGHVQSWNFDPQGYEAKLRTWLTRVVRDTM